MADTVPIRVLSNREKILIAAARLDEPFTLQELMVAAWRLDPESFGMRGYPYPCTNRLKPRIYGGLGAIAAGWLRWSSKKRDRLEITARGRHHLGMLDRHLTGVK